jgi:hypothetical protein
LDGGGRIDGDFTFAINSLERIIEKYFTKLTPVPEMEKDIHKFPAGERPIRNPEKPQLKPVPFFETDALAPPGSRMNLRQRQPIITA